MPTETTRREMLRNSAAAGAAVSLFTIVPRHVLGQGQTPPSEKVNVACIGIAGVGFGDAKNFEKLANVVAVCDVDERQHARAAKEWPAAKLHIDYRKMLEEQKDIDAVSIAVPDHAHAVITIAALKAGKHVHCQKPLTHTVHEARLVAKVAAETKRATQMGNYGHASEGHRLIQEMIWAGAIGKVTEVHSWSNRNPDISARGQRRPKDTPPCPRELHWDLWLGPAAQRPYHPAYHPFAWRGWWDFGSGVLGDIGCHEWSPVFKALKLGHPSVIEASSTNFTQPPEVTRESAPLASVTRYEFPATADHGPVKLYWYDGGIRPPRPEELDEKLRFGDNDGTLIVGEKGKIFAGRLIPDSLRSSYGKPPKKLERSPGHYQEFVAACKGGPTCGSDFVAHSAHLAEVVQLGVAAIKANARLVWDAEKMEFTNNKEANQFLTKPYREGWTL